MAARPTTRTRIRGDDYPIVVVFKVNRVAIDVSTAVLKFSYKNKDNAVRTIIGTATGTLGEAEFIPESGVDFIIAGMFTYDAQRIADGYTYTHEKGTLIIDDDVTV